MIGAQDRGAPSCLIRILFCAATSLLENGRTPSIRCSEELSKIGQIAYSPGDTVGPQQVTKRLSLPSRMDGRVFYSHRFSIDEGLGHAGKPCRRRDDLRERCKSVQTISCEENVLSLIAQSGEVHEEVSKWQLRFRCPIPQPCKRCQSRVESLAGLGLRCSHTKSICVSASTT